MIARTIDLILCFIFAEDYPYGDGDSAFDGYMKPEKDADGFENNYPAYDDAYAAY